MKMNFAYPPKKGAHLLRITSILVSLLISTGLVAQFENPFEYLLGNVLQRELESNHYSKKKINDELSQKAFKEYIASFDYRKHFFLKSDIDKLEKFKDKLDDEFTSGNIKSLELIDQILKERVEFAKKFTKEFLSKPVDLTQKDTLETDPKKTEFVANQEELKELWRKSLKYAVYSELVELSSEGEAKNKTNLKKKRLKPKKKTPPKKKRSFKELEKEARKNVGKDYEAYFTRIMREDRMTKLSKFYNSIVRVFDPHTVYFKPEDREDFDINLSGKLEGIGAVLMQDGQYIKVVRIVPGSASWKQKELEAEDTILKVAQKGKEPVSIVNMEIQDAVKLIRGERGTTVVLTVKKPDGNVKTISIVRDVVENEESYAKSLILKDNKIGKKVGYIELPSFYRDFNPRAGEDPKNCTDDVRAALNYFNKEKVDALILDLRDNGGGSLEDARLMTGLFIKDGPVVQVKDSEGRTDKHADVDPKIQFDKPMVVLVNRFSASASEILAGALQDYGRAIIVGGDHTHGKGTVQTVSSLDKAIPNLLGLGGAIDSLGALKVTIQQFYRITGSSTQNKGIIPDIILPDRLDFVESGERYLDFALPWEQIKPLSYESWDMGVEWEKLKKKSEERVEKSKKFAKIRDYVKWMKEQKEKTVRTLVWEEFKKEAEERRTMAEKFDIEEVNGDLKVEHHLKMRDKDEKERIEEYVEELKKDPVIEESIHILQDAVEMNKLAKA